MHVDNSDSTESSAIRHKLWRCTMSCNQRAYRPGFSYEYEARISGLNTVDDKMLEVIITGGVIHLIASEYVSESICKIVFSNWSGEISNARKKPTWIGRRNIMRMAYIKSNGKKKQKVRVNNDRTSNKNLPPSCMMQGRIRRGEDSMSLKNCHSSS